MNNEIKKKRNRIFYNTKNKELVILLDKWFKSAQVNNQDFWHRDTIAKTIKLNLNKWGNWRRRPKKYLIF